MNSRFRINLNEFQVEEDEQENNFNLLEFVDKCLEFDPLARRFCREFNYTFVDDIDDNSIKLIWIYLNGLDDRTKFLKTVQKFWIEDYGTNDNLACCHSQFKDNIIDSVFIIEYDDSESQVTTKIENDIVLNPYSFISLTK